MDLRQPSTEILVKCLSFEQLDNYTLYQMLALRSAVFCVEQNCVYQDADGKDQNAWHVLAYHQGQLAATCRILMPSESYADACSIGRVASSPAHRGIGVGEKLMQVAVAQCQQLFPDWPIRIGAQQYLEGFYQKFGFETISDSFLEDGIVHVTMQVEALNSGSSSVR